MATLYVENVPDELYEALRARAKGDGKSIAAAVIELIRRNVPTKADLERRRAFYQEILKFQAREPLTTGPHPSAEEMIREDRDR